jgi:hypothetical protein
MMTARHGDADDRVRPRSPGRAARRGGGGSGGDHGATLGGAKRIVLACGVIGVALGPGSASGQPSPSSSPAGADADSQECARREAIVATIARFEAAWAGGQPFPQLVAQMAEIEKQIIELQPAAGRTCPDHLSIAGLTERFDPIRHDITREHRRREINAKAWPEHVKLAVLEQRVELGMTRDQVAAAWGQPRSIDVTPTTRQEQWTYSGPTYLYFTSGTLATIARVRKPPE